MAEPLIRVESIVKQYTRDTQVLTVLDGISFSVETPTKFHVVPPFVL